MRFDASVAGWLLLVGVRRAKTKMRGAYVTRHALGRERSRPSSKRDRMLFSASALPARASLPVLHASLHTLACVCIRRPRACRQLSPVSCPAGFSLHAATFNSLPPSASVPEASAASMTPCRDYDSRSAVSRATVWFSLYATFHLLISHVCISGTAVEPGAITFEQVSPAAPAKHALETHTVMVGRIHLQGAQHFPRSRS